jgi:hypothetical protein
VPGQQIHVKGRVDAYDTAALEQGMILLTHIVFLRFASDATKKYQRLYGTQPTELVQHGTLTRVDQPEDAHTAALSLHMPPDDIGRTLAGLYTTSKLGGVGATYEFTTDGERMCGLTIQHELNPAPASC